jgi:hypothetical protein
LFLQAFLVLVVFQSVPLVEVVGQPGLFVVGSVVPVVQLASVQQVVVVVRL